MFLMPKLAALTEVVSTAYLLLSTAQIDEDLKLLDKKNDKIPLPQPRSNILLGLLVIFSKIHC